MMQQLERRLVGPVNVLENEKHRLFGGESLENAENQVERAFAIRRLIRPCCSTPFQVGKNRSDNVAKRVDHLFDGLCRTSQDADPDDIHQRHIRLERFIARAVTLCYPDRLGSRLVLLLAKQATLPNPYISAEQY